MAVTGGRWLGWFALTAVVGALAFGAARYGDWIRAFYRPRPRPEAASIGAVAPVAPRVLELSPQAQRNLRLATRPLKLQNYWRSILVPGEIVDRPGVSDRGVTSPAIGVVTQVHAFPGDSVQAGDRLFTLRLISEYIQNTQSELFRASRETELIREQRERLGRAAEGGAIAQSRLLDLEQQLRRQQAAIQGYRQDLLTRGLRPEQLAQVAEGRFVSTIDVLAPRTASAPPTMDDAQVGGMDDAQVGGTPERAPERASYELQELRVELGAQVQAGQLLAVLSDHRLLYIKGNAFKREASQLEAAAQNSWPVTVEFAEDAPRSWPALAEPFAIRHLANAIDTTSRTFAFFIPLTNQSRSYEKDGRVFAVWRFRPGQRVRLHVPVEEFKDVIVVPSGAVVREGAEAFLFRQNGDLFDRRPVHVLYEDRLQVVIANDGSVAPGWFVAQSNAASLNRVLKAQAASGVPAGLHVHADGSVHGAH